MISSLSRLSALILLMLTLRSALADKNQHMHHYHQPTEAPVHHWNMEYGPPTVMQGYGAPAVIPEVMEPAPVNTSAVTTRNQRSLGLPVGSFFNVAFDFGTPLFSSGDFSGSFSATTSFKYVLVSSSSGRRLDSDRRSLYGAIETSLSRFGVNGKVCLLKTICDVAEYPFEEYGALGEVLNTAMAASYRWQDDAMYEYAEAEYFGRYYGNCEEAYPCEFSISEVSNVVSNFV